ncbi:hypothetical protein MRX96_014349 [Rhipicephalus microplus]
MSRRHLRYDEPPQTALLLLRPKMRQARVLTHKSYRAAPEEAVLSAGRARNCSFELRRAGVATSSSPLRLFTGHRAAATFPPLFENRVASSTKTLNPSSSQTANRGSARPQQEGGRVRAPRPPLELESGARSAHLAGPIRRETHHPRAGQRKHGRALSLRAGKEKAREKERQTEKRGTSSSQNQLVLPAPPSPRRAVAIPSPERPPSRAHITLQPPSRTAALGQPRINEAVPVSAFDAALAHCKQVCVLSPGAANPLSSSRRERPPTDYTVDKQGETSHSATQRHQQDPGFPAQRSPSDNAEEENVDET